jgi:hypothetical protein
MRRLFETNVATGKALAVGIARTERIEAVLGKWFRTDGIWEALMEVGGFRPWGGGGCQTDRREA